MFCLYSYVQVFFVYNPLRTVHYVRLVTGFMLHHLIAQMGWYTWVRNIEFITLTCGVYMYSKLAHKSTTNTTILNCTN